MIALAVVASASIASACNSLLGINNVPAAADAGADATVAALDAAIDDSADPDAPDAAIDDASAIDDPTTDDAATVDAAIDAPVDTGTCIFPCTIGNPLCPGCGAGEQCDYDYFINHGTGCTNLGPAREGEDCNSAFCAQDLTCYHSVCRRFCDTPGAACTGGLPGTCVTVPTTPFHVCTLDCIPDDPLACVRGDGGTYNGCIYDYVSQLTDCQRVGTSTVTCNKKGCAPSYECAADGGACEKICRVDGGTCASPTTCAAPAAYPSAPWGTCR